MHEPLGVCTARADRWRDTGCVATEKGERRRAALVAAAADLLRTGGFEAVRHRAVAEKAGLPLASTTYYFASLDDLVTAATERTCRDELAEVRAGLEAVLLRYERLVGSGRRPYLAPLMRATRADFDALLAALLARAGHQLDVPALHRLVAVVDGTVVNSLIEADPDPRAAARAALLAELTT